MWGFITEQVLLGVLSKCKTKLYKNSQKKVIPNKQKRKHVLFIPKRHWPRLLINELRNHEFLLVRKHNFIINAWTCYDFIWYRMVPIRFNDGQPVMLLSVLLLHQRNTVHTLDIKPLKINTSKWNIIHDVKSQRYMYWSDQNKNEIYFFSIQQQGLTTQADTFWWSHPCAHSLQAQVSHDTCTTQQGAISILMLGTYLHHFEHPYFWGPFQELSADNWSHFE